MKKFIALTLIHWSLLSGQFSYPAEDFLGGGIGYSPMYIKLDSIPGASFLENLGLNPKNFSDPFVIHGGGRLCSCNRQMENRWICWNGGVISKYYS